MKDATVLTNLQMRYNDEHKHLRARVESVFGQIKDRFEKLHFPFAESDKQLDYLFFYAIGVHNCFINFIGTH